jgi:hypothetical protein
MPRFYFVLDVIGVKPELLVFSRVKLLRGIDLDPAGER